MHGRCCVFNSVLHIEAELTVVQLVLLLEFVALFLERSAAQLLETSAQEAELEAELELVVYCSALNDAAPLLAQLFSAVDHSASSAPRESVVDEASLLIPTMTKMTPNTKQVTTAHFTLSTKLIPSPPPMPSLSPISSIPSPALPATSYGMLECGSSAVQFTGRSGGEGRCAHGGER